MDSSMDLSTLGEHTPTQCGGVRDVAPESDRPVGDTEGERLPAARTGGAVEPTGGLRTLSARPSVLWS